MILLIQSLVILDWSLWAALLIALVYALFSLLATRRSSPLTGPMFGVFLLSLGLLFSAVTAVLLIWLADKQSLVGLVVITLLLAWPLFPLIAQPVMGALRSWKYTPTAINAGSLFAPMAPIDGTKRLKNHRW
jgi:hypothetical protein